MSDNVAEVRARSASSINTWNMCQRRWQFVYGSLALREAAGDAAEAGTRVHKWLENTAPADRAEPVWKKYEIQKMAELLAPLTPTEGLIREQQLDLTIDGVLFTLRMDFQYTPGLGYHGVGDYKTVGKPAGVKSVKKLTDDPQRLLYMRATGANEALWLYGVWSTMKVKPVKLLGDSQDKERFKLRVLQPAEDMSKIPFDAHPLSLPANTDSCMLFPPAGCPHRKTCFNLNGDLLYAKKTTSGTYAISTDEGEAPKMSSLFDPPFNPPVIVPPATNSTVHPGALAAFVESVREQTDGVPDTNIKPDFSSVRRPVNSDFVPVSMEGKFIDTLYVNALPLSGFSQDGVEYAHVYLDQAAKMVADSQHVHHVGLIDYSKGYVATEVQLIENLRLRTEERGAIQNMVLETTSRLGKECMLSLMSVSRRVVKGVI